MGIQEKPERTKTVWLKVISGFKIKGKLAHIIKITIYYLCIVRVLY